jgi:hypothetical protein
MICTQDMQKQTVNNNAVTVSHIGSATMMSLTSVIDRSTVSKVTALSIWLGNYVLSTDQAFTLWINANTIFN